MSAVLSSAFARQLMGDAMDARSLNHWQAQAISNDTPEVDCIVDHIAVLVSAGVRPSQVRDLLTLTRKLLDSNRLEGELEMQLCGSLDGVASRLHDRERNHGAAAPTVKAMGETLRWALPVVFDPAGHPAAERVAAGAAIDRLLGSVPAEQLLTASMRKELRNTNYGRLLELVGARQQHGEVAA